MTNNKKLPKFQSQDEATEFFEQHDLGDYLANMPEVKFEMNLISELDRVALQKDVTEFGLKKYDMGTVVHVYTNGEGYEVEFLNLNGETIAVITLNPTDIAIPNI